MIEPIFAFFQMQIKSMRRDAVKLSQATFGERPKALNAVDVIVADGKLILSVIDPEVFAVTDINQPIVAAPSVRVNDRFRLDATANDGLQRLLFAVRHNLGIDRTVAFEDAEDDCFARRAATALAAYTPGTEVGFIYFNRAAERRSAFSFFGESKAYFDKDSRHARSSYSGKFSRFAGGQIKRKILDNAAHFAFADF